MKKFFFSLFALYLLIVGSYFLTNWLLTHNIVPRKSLKNVSALLPNEFKGKKVIAVKYISRTHDAYVFTDTKDYYTFDLKEMKQVSHAKLEIDLDIKDITCREGNCLLLGKDKAIKVKDLSGFIHSTGAVKKIEHLPWSSQKIKHIDRILYYEGTIIGKVNGKLAVVHARNQNVAKNILKRVKYIQKIFNTDDFEITEYGSIYPRAYCKKFLQISFVELHNHDHHQLTGLLDLYHIKEIAVDSESISYWSTNGNVIFSDTKGKIYKAQITNSIFQDIHRYSQPFAYLPMLFIMMFA